MDALIIIDMQNGCVNGEPPRRDVDGVVARINALADAIRPNGLVVHVQHTDPSDGYTPGTEHWQLISSIRREGRDEIVEKYACDSFLESRLGELLEGRGVTDLIITGCATDFCVDTTVRAAGARGYNVTVATDAHTTRDRPHLCAVDIIAHHHYMWNDLILLRGARIRLAPTDELLEEFRSRSYDAPAPLPREADAERADR